MFDQIVAIVEIGQVSTQHLNDVFALVSIDCDLYESTASVLEHLLGKKTYSDGYAGFFDDWYCNRGSPEFGKQRAWAEYTARYKIRFADWGPYLVVGRKFILYA